MARKKTTSKKTTKAIKKKGKKAAKKTKKKTSTAKKAKKKTKTKTLKARKTSSKKSMKSRPSTGTLKTPAAATTRVSTLNVGDFAPDFTLPNQNSENVSLSALRGRRVVLYFYPKDDTPGCTKEACGFRDNLPRFSNTEALIYGVSFDDPESHRNFISKYGLNFDLLSDTEKSVAEAYGVYVEKNMYGKTYMGIERTTFIIDPSGRISEIFRQVKVDGHTEEVLEALQKIA